MVVVFFGTPQFAVPTLRRLLASRHHVRGVVTQPDRPRGRGQKVTDSPVKAVALEHGIPVLQPDRLRDPDVLAALQAWAPDLGVVVAYGKMIPDNLLAVPRFGMINVHASLLPKYRGAAPIHRAVIAGEAETGVTIQRVTTQLDAGNMLARATRPIGPDDTSEDVERDLAEMGGRLLVEVVDRLERGETEDQPQDGSASTYAAKLTKQESLVDWSLPAVVVHNRIRGLPQAYTYFQGKRLILLKTRVVPEATALDPGTVVDAETNEIKVATGNHGVIAIKELQPEGRRAMRVRDFLAGRPIERGARFTGP